MHTSLKIGSVAGIGIFLHWTFGLLVAGLFAFYLVQGNTVVAALVGVGLILALFACVILHELGHALMARRFGVPTKDITLYPIGGVARLQRLPEEPMKEFWIAVAGPAVNVAIAAALAAVVTAAGFSFAPETVLRPGQNLLASLLWLNVALAAFNLLPAFPMDGGRVLRALLATRLNYARATQIAAGVGQGMAILFALVGLVVEFNPVLLFIALFVYLGARQEARQATLRDATRGRPVREAMMTRFRTLAPDEPLSAAVDALLAGAEHDFPIVEGGTVVGLLTRAQLLKALSERGRDVSVGEVAGDERFTVEAESLLGEAFQRMQAAGCSTVPVLQDGQLVGLLTLENVGELIQVSSALKRRGEASPQGRGEDERGRS